VALENGLTEVHIRIQQLHLKPGRYPVGLWLSNGDRQIFDWVESAFEIEVTNNDYRLGSELLQDGVVACDFDVSSSPLT
jgi:hypothetical protein